MNAAAEGIYERAKAAGFPAVGLGGTIREGALSWWAWASAAPGGEIERAHRELDELETRGGPRERDSEAPVDDMEPVSQDGE